MGGARGSTVQTVAGTLADVDDSDAGANALGHDRRDTHSPVYRAGAFPSGGAKRIDDSPGPHLTAKHDGRLNMAIFERSALQRHCGARRMPNARS